jgi:hypothetical protein
MSMMKDERTQEYIKAWGRKDVPTALVTNGKVRSGTHPAFVLLGWVRKPPEKLVPRAAQWPVIILRLALLNKPRTKSIGGLLMTMPFNPKTERHVCSLMQDFGWDGRVWPHEDDGWPSKTTEEEPLINLLKKEKLGATFTFPSDPEKGIIALPVPVKKRRGPFALALFNEVVPKHLETLRVFASDPKPFEPDWP